MNTSKIIKGVVNSGRYTVTAPIMQEHYGIILQIEGAELPETYQVDFSNDEHHGISVTMIGNADGVLIPRQFIDTGKDVFAFLYWVGEDYGKTVYKFRIPNKVRPGRTDEQPTPEEQSVIDQTIAALNDAVESAQEAQQAIEDMSVSAGSLPEGSEATVTKTESGGVVHLDFGIPRGQTGDTPTITASKTGKTTSIYVDGSEVVQIEDGTDGTDGTSPNASVTKSGKVATITITDKNGTTSAQVEDGTDGTDGISPTVSITPITGGHRITITDADGEHSADVMDGDDYTLTAQDKQDIAELVDVPVEDVQINGTSIVEDGVANVPIASANELGAVKIGNGVYVSSSENKLYASSASASDIKHGTSYWGAIIPRTTHNATFYGLAKAAGDTTQSQSSNAVGNYTEDAKIAIQKMLGIYQAPWELIREDTFTNEEEADHIIDVDANGEAFELTEAVILFETPTQETPSSMGSYGSIYLHFNRGSAKKVECGTWTQAANASAHGCGAVLLRHGNLVELGRIAVAPAANTGVLGYRYGTGFGSIGIASDRLSYAIDNDNLFVNKMKIKSVLGTGHYKLYGRRKWQ